MHSLSLLLSILLAGTSATGASAANTPSGQESAKIPRPLPPPSPDKSAPDLTEMLTADSIAAIAHPPVRPRPANAPSVDGISASIDRVHVGEPGDGRIWARGADYKASFGAEGATFIPFLGSSAPRNQPVRFELVAATLDDAPITLTAPSVHREAERIVLDRGVIDEVYDLALENMEQTFVVERLPERGALRLEIAVESAVAGIPHEEGLLFAGDLGGVRYGGVTVIDAAGARFETSPILVDGRIRIDVPAEFVAAARLPLRVDPLIATFQATPAGGVDQFYADMAFDVSANVWCLVFEEVFSASDHDVWTELLSVTGSVVFPSLAAVDYTTDLWGRPCIANNNLANNFMVAAVVYPPPGTTSSIKVCTRDALSLAVGTQVEVSGTDFGLKVYCDIGGDPSTVGPTYYQVVWQRIFNASDTDIHGRLVSSTGVPLGSGVTYIDNSSGTYDQIPRISNSNGLPPDAEQDWNVVWTRVLPGGGTDVYGAQVHWDGLIRTPTFPIDVSFNSDATPSASSPLDRASGPRPWMAVYHRSTTGDGDIAARVFQGSTQLAVSNLTYNEGVGVAQDQLDVDVDTDGSQFFVTYRQNSVLNPSAYSVYASAFAYADNVLLLSESHLLLGSAFTTTLPPRVAAEHSSGAVSRKFGATWSRLSGSVYEVNVGLFETPYDVPITTYCSGDGSTFTCPCGNQGASGRGCAHSASTVGAALVAAGTRHVSNDVFAITATGVPSNTTGLLFQGTTQNAVSFGDGELCVGGTIVRLSVKPANATVLSFPSGTDLPLSVQGLIPAVGANRNYQVWFRDAAPFCTPSSFNLTNALHVVWLP